MARIYAISDIHGCLSAFQEALSLMDLLGDAYSPLRGGVGQ